MITIKIKKIRQHLTVLKKIAPGLLLTLFLVNHTAAATIDINPVRIFLDPQTRMEKLTLKNTGEEVISAQLMVYEWTQDEKGQDIYQETKDLILFPKIVTVKKGEEKIIRVGTNQNFGAREKTYRIYVEELPPAEKKDTDRTVVSVLFRLGIPVFISPVQKNEKGAIEALTLQKGKAEIKLKNNGNRHLLVSTIQVKGLNNQGKEIFSKDLSGWYIMSGLSRAYETAIPLKLCQEITKLDIEAKTSSDNINITIKDQLEVKKSMCGGQSI